MRIHNSLCSCYRGLKGKYAVKQVENLFVLSDKLLWICCEIDRPSTRKSESDLNFADIRFPGTRVNSLGNNGKTVQYCSV